MIADNASRSSSSSDLDERRSVELVEGGHVRHPDHVAAGADRRAHAGVGVLDRHAVGGVDAEPGRGEQVGLGMGLAAGHLLTGDDGLERARWQLGDDRIDEPAPRHRHERARHTRRVELGQQAASSVTPRNPFLDLGDDAVEQAVDDLLRFQRDLAVLGDVGAADEEIVADERVGVLVGPGVAVRLDQRVLGVDPVRLGVDERAVHVPQDGRGAGVHGC